MFNWFKKNKNTEEDEKEEDQSLDKNEQKNPADDKTNSQSVDDTKSKSAEEPKSDQNSENASSVDPNSASDRDQGEEATATTEQEEVSEADSGDTEDKTDIEGDPGDKDSTDSVDDKSHDAPKSILRTKTDGNNSEKSVRFEEEHSAFDIVEGEQYYTFDDAVDHIGYGRFQRIVTLLTGIAWFAEAYAIIITSILGDLIACDWTMYMWEVAMMTSAMFIGMMVGAPLFGVIADVFGRRLALTVSYIIGFGFGALSAIAPSVVWMMVCRCLMGFALGSLAQGVTLCLEFYPVKDRGTAGFYINYYWCVGNACLILTAWVIMETTYKWRWLVFASSVPCLVAFISMNWSPESVRYYMVCNQYDKAVAQLEKLSVSNKVALPPGKLKIEYMDREESMGNIVQLLRPPHTLTTLLYWYIWFAVSFHYYGLALVTPVIIKQGRVRVSPAESANAAGGTNATSSMEFFVSEYPCHTFSTENYLDLFWTGCSEIPGIVIYPFLVKYFARKKLLAVAVLINTMLVLLLLINFESALPPKIFIFTARTNSGGFFQLIMIMTGEAFPTTLRATSLGTSHSFSMFGAALVPFAAQVLIINQPVIAVCLMSGAVFLVAIAASLLPREMKDERMKDFSEEFHE